MKQIVMSSVEIESNRRVLEVGDYRMRLKPENLGAGPVWFLTLFFGGEVLIATNEIHGRRAKIFRLWETLEAGIRAKAGKDSDERRERARGGME